MARSKSPKKDAASKSPKGAKDKSPKGGKDKSAKGGKDKGGKGGKGGKGAKDKSKKGGQSKGGGDKSKKKKKGKKSKKEKKEKKEKTPPPPPDRNVFVCVRRKNVTLCMETHGEELIREFRVQVATIMNQFPEDIKLYSMLGKEPEEMEDQAKPKKDDKKKPREDDKLREARAKEKLKGKKERGEWVSPEAGPAGNTISVYGYNPATGNIFKPGQIGLVYRAEDGVAFDEVDITPYSEFPFVPEEIKTHLRNYVPPPPPKKGNYNRNNNNNNNNNFNNKPK